MTSKDLNEAHDRQLGAFANVDKADSEDFISRLDQMQALDAFRAYKGTTFELLRLSPGSKVADIGCGTGASTLVLAGKLKNAQITAVDIFPEFLDVLARNAEAAGLADAIAIVNESMDSLTFADESLDLIWSEGAIYNIGFARGVEAWRRFLRPGGLLVVSEITWLRPDPPGVLRRHWESEYPEIGTAGEKISVLERAGYDLRGYFVLPSSCWIENYYEPIEARMVEFLRRHAGQQEARELADMERQEAKLYRQYHDFVSYGFYIARKQ